MHANEENREERIPLLYTHDRIKTCVKNILVKKETKKSIVSLKFYDRSIFLKEPGCFVYQILSITLASAKTLSIDL